MSETKKVFGPMISPAVYLLHTLFAEAHTKAAHTACGLASAHLGSKGMWGKKTVHFGAGLGLDARVALQHGAEYALGLEASPDQVAVAQLLRTGAWDAITEMLCNDPAQLLLYKSAEVYLENLSYPLYQEQKLLEQILGSKVLTEVYDVIQYDVFNQTPGDVLSGQKFSVGIANMSLQWMVRPPHNLLEALTSMAQPLHSGGVLVCSVPAHFLKPADPSVPLPCFYEDPLYRSFSRSLDAVFGKHNQTVLRSPEEWHKSMQVIPEEMTGTAELELLQIQQQWMAPLHYMQDSLLPTLGLFEAISRTNQPGSEMARMVKEAHNLHEEEEVLMGSLPVLMFYFVFRKK